MTRRELWEVIGMGEVCGCGCEGGGGGGEDVKHMFFDVLQLVRGFLY